MPKRINILSNIIGSNSILVLVVITIDAKEKPIMGPIYGIMFINAAKKAIVQEC